jgi:MtrB/PioB family decaheme-associated outer membrane protein
MSARSGGNFRRGALALAAFAACGPLWAQEADEVKAMTTPQSSLGAGIGYVSQDNTRFGQYSGLTKEGLYPLIDLDLRRRNDETGTWMNLRGRNLGLESNELRWDHARQGSWGYYLEYNQTPRYSQYTALTTLANPDSPNQVVNGVATPYELELKTLRKNFSGGFEGRLTGNWTYGVRFANEDKDGRRLFGRSGATSFQEFLVDPVDYNTRTWEANASYTDQKWQLVAAYNGTSFTNYKTNLSVTGSTSVYTPIGLPPENASNQVSVTGGYNFSDSTRATFKASYMNQTQSASFIDVSSTGRTDLGGQVTTTFLQGGVQSRPMKDLTLIANVRYENRDDKTPVVDYFNFTTTSTATGENEPRSIKTLNGKLEALYRMARGWTAVGGIEFDEKKRNTSSVRVVSFRDTTDETTLRAELRRSMSQTLNGSIAYLYSNRGGSEWQNTVTTSNTSGSNLVHPVHLADRERNLLRGKLGWAANERLDVNFVADLANDEYGGRSLGLSDGKATHFALDAAMRLSGTWTATAWVSQDDTRSTLKSCEAASSIGVCPNTAADPMWQAKLTNSSFAFGAGVRGKPRTATEFGFDAQYVEDDGKWEQGPLDPGTTPLPNTKTKRGTLKAFAKRTLDKNLSLRAQYTYDHFFSNDWQWTTWRYGDGTTILTNPDQKVHFIAVQLQYGF